MLWLDGVPPAVLDEAARTGLLVGRLGLTDPKGNPTCSAGRPPTIEWSAGTRRKRRVELNDISQNRPGQLCEPSTRDTSPADFD